MLSAHLTFSVGWIGSVVAYLALAIAAMRSTEATTVRAGWIAMELTGWYAIVPLAIASFLTGLVMALGTKWGLFRHYWVIFSLVLTAFALIVLLLHMPTVSAITASARTADITELKALGNDVFHPAVGLVVLLAVQVLNLYKPKGVTGFGRRRQSTAAPALTS